MENVLRVRNIEQAAAWLELDGQISDGTWENTPGSDWQTWCRARVTFEHGPVGRNFHTTYDKFNFANKQLLDVVGIRMLGTIRIARRCGLAVADALQHYIRTDDGLINWDNINYEHMHEDIVEEMDRFEVMTALADQSYTMADMKKDLIDLKSIIKTWTGDRA